MIHRIHRDAANVRSDSLPTRSPGFAQRNILVFDVAHLAHGRATFDRHAPHFAGGHAQLRELAFLRQELREHLGDAVAEHRAAALPAEEALAARTLGDGFGDPQRYVTLARFFAENISVQAGSLERTVMDSAEAVNGADAVLLA